MTALYVVGVDGSDPHRITPWGITPGDADWSPDGQQIVFETITQHLGNGASVMVVNRDGGGLHALTRDAGITGIGRWESLQFEASFDPVWSPDGTQIMFSHDLKTADGVQTGLQLISPDGTGQQWASDLRDHEHQVDWGTAPLRVTRPTISASASRRSAEWPIARTFGSAISCVMKVSRTRRLGSRRLAIPATNEAKTVVAGACRRR